MADTTKAKAAAARVDTTELGSAGLKVYSGIIYEEYLRALQGRKAVEVYRRMSESDPTISACLFAFFLILRSVKWRTDPAENSGAKGDAEAEFVDSLFDDMSHSWQDFLSETLTMLTYGWHYAEIVLKRRVGPYEKDPAKRSKFTDGRIGIRKLAPRAQDTLWRWEFQDDGGIQGMHQWSPTSYKEVFVPIERALLFRTSSQKNNPEGKSILRAAYRPWHKMTVIEDAEGVGIERELAGLPVAYIPGRYLNANASSEDKAFAAAIQKMVRDVKFNEQAGVVLPSDPFRDSENNPSAMAQVKFELLSSGGARSIDTNVVVQRHQTAITRSMLADFLMLGQSKGAFNLGENKTEMFYRACEAVLEQIAAPINNFLIPRIWDYNGLDRALMPKRVPGRVAPVNLNEIGTYLAARAQAGDMIFPDPTLTEFLNEIAYMPPPSPETLERKPEDLLPPQLRSQGGQGGQVIKPADEKPPPDQEVEATSGVRKFNPYHRPGGDEHGGEFTSSGTGVLATDLLASDPDKDKSFDQVMNELTPEQRAKFKEAERLNAEGTPTNGPVEKGGFMLPDGTYTEARQELHRQILQDLFTPGAIKAATPPDGVNPTVVFTGGRSGAGKTSGMKMAGLDFPGYFNINADDIQTKLPGYTGSKTGLFNHEAQDIAVQAEKTARNLGLNIVYDATMKTGKSAIERAKTYADAGYDLEGYFSHTSPATATKRVIDRFFHTGRFVPPELPFNSKTNEQTFETLKPMLKKWALFDNNGTAPKLVAKGGF